MKVIKKNILLSVLMALTASNVYSVRVMTTRRAKGNGLKKLVNNEILLKNYKSVDDKLSRYKRKRIEQKKAQQNIQKNIIRIKLTQELRDFIEDENLKKIINDLLRNPQSKVVQFGVNENDIKDLEDECGDVIMQDVQDEQNIVIQIPQEGQSIKQRFINFCKRHKGKLIIGACAVTAIIGVGIGLYFIYGSNGVTQVLMSNASQIKDLGTKVVNLSKKIPSVKNLKYTSKVIVKTIQKCTPVVEDVIPVDVAPVIQQAGPGFFHNPFLNIGNAFNTASQYVDGFVDSLGGWL